MLSREVTNTNFIVLFDLIESKSMTYHMICFQHNSRIILAISQNKQFANEITLTITPPIILFMVLCCFPSHLCYIFPKFPCFTPNQVFFTCLTPYLGFILPYLPFRPFTSKVNTNTGYNSRLVQKTHGCQVEAETKSNF